MVIKAYPRTHYEEFKKYGYRIMLFEKVITHLTECHYHDYYELSIVLGCHNVVYQCGETEYPIGEGDIVFSNVFEPHVYKVVGPDAYCERFNLGVEFTRLMQFSAKGVNLSLMFQQSNTKYPVIRLPFKSFLKYSELVEIYQKGELQYADELRRRGLVQLFLAYIYEDTRPYLEIDTRNAASVKTVTLLIEYIQAHLHENITLADLSKEANYSVSYICSAFRSVMNKTINDYIKEKRLDLAIHYLKTDLPIAEAAKQAGFNNYSYFYKTFKGVYGVSPVEYRSRMQNGEDLNGVTAAGKPLKA